MDAKAHLLSLGWAGPGHSLDSRPSSPGTYKQKGHRGLAYDPSKDPLKVGNTGNGLVKPLLVSQRKNRFGIGKRAHEAPAGNEWWLKGFESALGNIGKSESERDTSGTSTPVNGILAKRGGLYSFFVQGQVMQGTIGLDKRGKKRKSDEYEEGSDGCVRVVGELKLNPRPTSPKKPATAKEFEMVGAFMRERDKLEKRKNGSKMDKNAAEQFAQMGEFFGVVEKEGKRSKKRKSGVLDEVENGEQQQQHERESEDGVETKEQRRERRRKRKEEKAARLAATASNGLNGTNGQSEAEDSATKAARRAERKRRKAEKAARGGE